MAVDRLAGWMYRLEHVINPVGWTEDLFRICVSNQTRCGVPLASTVSRCLPDTFHSLTHVHYYIPRLYAPPLSCFAIQLWAPTHCFKRARTAVLQWFSVCSWSAQHHKAVCPRWAFLLLVSKALFSERVCQECRASPLVVPTSADFPIR